MAYVKEGKVQCSPLGCTLTFINHAQRKRPNSQRFGLMVKTSVTIPVHEESAECAPKFIGERVSFEVKEGKAIITGLSIRRILRNCTHANWTESTDGSQKECDYCGLTIPIKQ